MGIVRSPDEGWTKEMAKYETRPVFIGGTYITPIPREHGGHENHPFEEYPKALYRAESANGGPRICDYRVASDERDEQVLKGQGFLPSQEAALEGVFAHQTEMARLAANRAYQDRWMGQKAREEAAAVDETTMEHLGEIPPTPIKKRRGRAPGYTVTKKPAPVATGE